MTLYEVELRVEYSRKVLVDCPDEDAAAEQAADLEEVRIAPAPTGSVSYYGIRAVTKEEVEG